MATKTSYVYQIKVTLKDSQPPIWRRILVPANHTFYQLHHTLQFAMGWYDYHLHQFTINGDIYGDPADDEFDDLGTRDETKFKLSKLIARIPFRFTYEYDFGDGWEHILAVEKLLPAERGVHYPVCLAGKRACPPEDVGGVWGYQNFLTALRDPENPEHAEYLEWVGDNFDPEAFDLEAINRRLKRTIKNRRETEDDWFDEDDLFEEEAVQVAPRQEQFIPSDLKNLLSDVNESYATNVAIRLDTLAFIAYLRDNKVTGTQSTGNLPRKAIEAIAARFVKPPILQNVIGTHTFRFQNELEVWPIYFVHILASAAGLASGGQSKRWRMTKVGEQFISQPAILQVWALLYAYWHKVNWLITYPYQGMGDSLPFEFQRATLSLLLEQPVGITVQFQPFADQLIQTGRLGWSKPDLESVSDILRSAVERMVIQPMAQFGVLECLYGSEKIGAHEYPMLVSFQVTPLGKALLTVMSHEK